MAECRVNLLVCVCIFLLSNFIVVRVVMSNFYYYSSSVMRGKLATTTTSLLLSCIGSDCPCTLEFEGFLKKEDCFWKKKR